MEPCYYCESQGTRRCFAIKISRSVLSGLLVAVLAVLVAYRIDSSKLQADLDELQDEIRALEAYVGTLQTICVEEKEEDNTKQHNKEMFDDCGRLNEQAVKSLFYKQLRVFEVDQTGMTDYAMRALGGSVVNTKNTIPYEPAASKINILGISLRSCSKNPSIILEPNSLPGDCWAFKGKQGVAVLRLFAPILVTSVTLEHIPREISPAGEISSAPRSFSLVGLEDPSCEQGHSYGSFVYKEGGTSLQTFPVVHKSSSPVQFVRVDFQDNYGNNEFTCVYRVRIHGERK